MKKYLGSRMTAYAAVICPLLVIAPLLFAIVALCSEISTATLLLAVLFCSCSVIYIIYKKKYKYIVPLTPFFAILLSCIFSPVNGSFRYILPIIFSVPIILSIDYLVYRNR